MLSTHVASLFPLNIFTCGVDRSANLQPKTQLTHPCWKANSCSASQEIPCVLQSSTWPVYHDPQESSSHPYAGFLKTHFNIILPSNAFQIISTLHVFRLKFCYASHPSTRDACPVHLNLLDLIIPVFNKEITLWHSSLGNVLQLPVTSSVFGLNSPWHPVSKYFLIHTLLAFSKRESPYYMSLSYSFYFT